MYFSELNCNYFTPYWWFQSTLSKAVKTPAESKQNSGVRCTVECTPSYQGQEGLYTPHDAARSACNHSSTSTGSAWLLQCSTLASPCRPIDARLINQLLEGQQPFSAYWVLFSGVTGTSHFYRVFLLSFSYQVSVLLSTLLGQSFSGQLSVSKVPY